MTMPKFKSDKSAKCTLDGRISLLIIVNLLVFAAVEIRRVGIENDMKDSFDRRIINLHQKMDRLNNSVRDVNTRMDLIALNYN